MLCARVLLPAVLYTVVTHLLRLAFTEEADGLRLFWLEPSSKMLFKSFPITCLLHPSEERWREQLVSTFCSSTKSEWESNTRMRVHPTCRWLTLWS